MTLLMSINFDRYFFITIISEGVTSSSWSLYNSRSNEKLFRCTFTYVLCVGEIRILLVEWGSSEYFTQATHLSVTMHELQLAIVEIVDAEQVEKLRLYRRGS